VPRFRKRPVEVEAIRYDGTNGRRIMRWCGDDRAREHLRHHRAPYLEIYGADGAFRAEVGDWIVRDGESLYTVESRIFAENFEAVEHD